MVKDEHVKEWPSELSQDHLIKISKNRKFSTGDLFASWNCANVGQRTISRLD